jgi:hypothetical protein
MAKCYQGYRYYWKIGCSRVDKCVLIVSDIQIGHAGLTYTLGSGTGNRFNMRDSTTVLPGTGELAELFTAKYEHLPKSGTTSTGIQILGGCDTDSQLSLCNT